jgi:hypothetical protein
MSKVTPLASGRITTSERITVELISSDDMPPIVKVTGPLSRPYATRAATPRWPRLYDLARIKARRRLCPTSTNRIVNASNEATLRTVLASVANKMLADFNASSVAKHSGSKGTVREAQLLSNYLRKYLPRNVIAEHSGEVVAANGAVSGQCTS